MLWCPTLQERYFHQQIVPKFNSHLIIAHRICLESKFNRNQIVILPYTIHRTYKRGVNL